MRLHSNYTTRSVPVDFVAWLTAAACSLLTTVALGSRPAPERHSAWPHQAASSRATLTEGTARVVQRASSPRTAGAARQPQQLRPGVWSLDSLRPVYISAPPIVQ